MSHRCDGFHRKIAVERRIIKSVSKSTTLQFFVYTGFARVNPSKTAAPLVYQRLDCNRPDSTSLCHSLFNTIKILYPYMHVCFTLAGFASAHTQADTHTHERAREHTHTHTRMERDRTVNGLCRSQHLDSSQTRASASLVLTEGLKA